MLLTRAEVEQIHENTTSIRSSTWQFSQGLCSTVRLLVTQSVDLSWLQRPTTEMRVPAHLWAPSSPSSPASPPMGCCSQFLLPSPWSTLSTPPSLASSITDPRCHPTSGLDHDGNRRQGSLIISLEITPDRVS